MTTIANRPRRRHLLALTFAATLALPSALASPALASPALASPEAESLRTEVIFLREGGMGVERAMTVYDRVIGARGESSITVGRQPNMLVVRDTPPRLKRFRALLTALDRPGEDARVFIRPVHHLAPSELAARVAELDVFDPAAVQLVPDDRSGQLVVSASLAEYRRLDALIRKLDVAGGAGRQIRVTPGPSDGSFPP